jgi:hypothetical protein
VTGLLASAGYLPVHRLGKRVVAVSRGRAVCADVRVGRPVSADENLGGDFDADGRLPVNVDGGLKSFGHPAGVGGLRMLFEAWLQFRGQAGDRQLSDPHTALTHNLGGRPGACVSFVSVVTRERHAH